MNITVFKRVRVGELMTYIKILADRLPERFASDKAKLLRAYAEMEYRLNADRRNHTLQILKGEQMPVLRFLVTTLGRELRLCGARGDNDNAILRYVGQKFKKRKNIERMINEAQVLCAMDAPENGESRSVFLRIQTLVTEMTRTRDKMSEEGALIATIGSCIPVRDEAVRILARIKCRAVALAYEEETAEMANDVIDTLETLIGMAERMMAARKAKSTEKEAEKEKEKETQEVEEEETRNRGVEVMKADEKTKEGRPRKKRRIGYWTAEEADAETQVAIDRWRQMTRD